MKRYLLLVAAVGALGALVIGVTVANAEGDDDGGSTPTTCQVFGNDEGDDSAEADDVEGTNEADDVEGTEADDDIDGNEGDDQIEAGEGDDDVCGDQGNDE